MYGGGGWYCASVYDQTVPLRESSTSSNSSLKQLGFLQNVASRGKEMVPQDWHFVPIRAGSSPVVNQPSTAGVTLPFGAGVAVSLMQSSSGWRA